MMTQQIYETLVADRQADRRRAAEARRIGRGAAGAVVRTSAPAVPRFRRSHPRPERAAVFGPGSLPTRHA